MYSKGHQKRLIGGILWDMKVLKNETHQYYLKSVVSKRDKRHSEKKYFSIESLNLVEILLYMWSLLGVNYIRSQNKNKIIFNLIK